MQSFNNCHQAPVVGLGKCNMFSYYSLLFFLVDMQTVSLTGGVKHVMLLFKNAVIAKQNGKDHHSRLVPVACFHSFDVPSLCSFHCV